MNCIYQRMDFVFEFKQIDVLACVVNFLRVWVHEGCFLNTSSRRLENRKHGSC